VFGEIEIGAAKVATCQPGTGLHSLGEPETSRPVAAKPELDPIATFGSRGLLLVYEYAS
jgi:hypothetical protein